MLEKLLDNYYVYVLYYACVAKQGDSDFDEKTVQI